MITTISFIALSIVLFIAVSFCQEQDKEIKKLKNEIKILQNVIARQDALRFASQVRYLPIRKIDLTERQEQ